MTKIKKLGSFADISFTSFHAAHIVSMGVGGGVFTSNPELAKKVRMYRDWGRQADTTGKNKHKNLPKDYNPRFIYEKIGYNFQILELQAAMGRVQLRKIAKTKAARKRNFNYLVKHLSKYPELIMPSNTTDVAKKADICWFSLPLSTCGHRGNLVEHLEKNGIETRSLFTGNVTRHPAYDKSMYRIGPDGLKEADWILHQSFWISVHPSLTREDLEYVVKVFDNYYAKTTTS